MPGWVGYRNSDRQFLIISTHGLRAPDGTRSRLGIIGHWEIGLLVQKRALRALNTVPFAACF
jgi:hypothetical protein